MIKNYIKASGYYFAKIKTSQINNEEQNSVQLIYDVDLGERAKIKNIVFEFIPNKKNKDLINQFIKVNNFKKIKKNDLINMEERLKHIKKSNKNTEYYTININQKIKNIEIYG